MYDLDSMPEGTLFFLGLLGIIALIVGIIFIISLQNALNAVSADNRKMPSGQVWLLLIPLFNIIWYFFVVIRIADSFRDEFYRLNIPYREERPTYNIGLTTAILRIASFLPSFLGNIASLASLVTWIIYWVKVVECRKLIEANQHNSLLDAEQGIFHGSGNNYQGPTPPPYTGE